MKRLLLAALIVGGCAGSPRSPETSVSNIRQALEEMRVAWNRDDLDAHIAFYAESATWMTSTGVLQGRPAIRESLARSFKRGDDLIGELSFSDTQFHRVSDDVVITTGAFELTGLPSGNPIKGSATLVWVRAGSSWAIVHDHSS